MPIIATALVLMLREFRLKSAFSFHSNFICVGNRERNIEFITFLKRVGNEYDFIASI